MGVITQKDIVKIINSSIDNIQVVIDTLATNISKVTKSANTTTLKNNLNLFTEIEKFINEYVKVMDVITSTIPKLRFSKLQTRMALDSINNVMEVILKFVNSLTDEAFNKFDPKQLLSRLEDIKNIVVSVEALFKSTSSMAKYSSVIILFGWMVKLSIRIIISIIKTIINLSELSISKDKEKAFMKLKNIFDGIYDISKKLIKLIPLSIVATVGAIVTAVFVLELCAFVLVVGLLSKSMRFISDKAVKGIRRLSDVFEALIWVSIWILILAIAAPAVSVSLLIVIALVLILMLSVAILAVALFLTSKLAKFARKQAIIIAWSLILITGIFIIMCLAIVLAGTAGTILLEDGAVLKVIIGLAAIAAMLGAFIGIGKIMSKAEKSLLSLKTSLVPLLGVLGLIALIIVEMVGLALFGKFLMQGNHIISITVGLAAIVGVIKLVVFIGKHLSGVKKDLVSIQKNVISLLIVLGLFVLVGLSIVEFGLIGRYLEKNILYVLAGFFSIAIIAYLIVIITNILDKVNTVESIKVITPLLIILGLFVLVGLSIIEFGVIGKYLEENIIYVAVGFGAIIVVAVAIVVIAKLLTKIQMAGTTIKLTLLLVVLGLFVLAGLSIIMFGKIGQYLEENLAYVLAGFAAIIVVAVAIIGLGLALTAAFPFILLTLAVALTYAAAIGMLIVVGLAINKFGEIDLLTTKSIVLNNIKDIALIGLALSELGFLMLPIVVGCVLLVALITPLLTAVLLVALAIKSIEVISNAKIDNNAVDVNIQSISLFWESVKDLLNTFNLKDLFLFNFALIVCVSISSITLAIEKIAEKLQKIASIELDDVAILGNVEKIFNCVTDLATRVEELLTGPAGNSPLFEVPETGFFSFFKENKPTTKDKLDNVKRILATLTGIASGLNEIQKFTLEEDTILSVVDNIFTFISELSAHIENCLTNTSVFNDKIVKEATWWGGIKDVREKNPSIEKLDNVSKITKTLKKITQTLEDIQTLEIDQNIILGTVTFIFDFIEELSMFISQKLSENTVFDDKIVKEATWWGGIETHRKKNDSLKRLDKVSQVISVLGNICTALSSIQKLTINESKIRSNVEYVFSFISDLCNFIEENMSGLNVFEDNVTWKWVEGGLFSSGYWEKQIEENQTANKISDIEKVVASMGNIMESLKLLGEVELTEDVKSTINANIRNIFDYIQEITIMVNDLMNPTNSGVIDNNQVAHIINENGSEYAEKLGSVGQIFTTLNDILDCINKIKDIKLSENDANTIKININFLFKAIEFIITTTNNNLDALGGQSINTDNLDIIVNSITTLTDTIQNLNDIRIDGFRTNSRSIIDFLVNLSNVELDMDRASGINNSLNAINTFISNNDRNFERAQRRIDFMDRVNTVVKALSEVTPEQVNRSKEMIKAQIAYLDKVNSIDIAKLKTSSRMIESMAKLSASIRGNFEGLAESINEDLMPVLQELKEIMEKIPEKLDTGFQNTSASIGAMSGFGSNMNTSAMSEQVKRENPNLTSEEVEQIADQRIRQYARTQSGAKTITDLYNLFLGQTGTAFVKLKTSN